MLHDFLIISIYAQINNNNLICRYGLKVLVKNLPRRVGRYLVGFRTGDHRDQRAQHEHQGQAPPISMKT